MNVFLVIKLKQMRSLLRVVFWVTVFCVSAVAQENRDNGETENGLLEKIINELLVRQRQFNEAALSFPVSRGGGSCRGCTLDFRTRRRMPPMKGNGW